MKRAKRIYILLGILAAACAATFIILRVEEKKEQIRNSDEIILEIAADSVESLAWENEETSLSFHKEDSWVYDDDSAFPVDDEKIGELLARFESFGVSFIIEEVEDYGQYGLDDSVCTISLSAGDQSYEITLGDYSTMDSERYVSIGDGNVYLVPEDPLDYFDAVLSDMIKNDEIPSLDTVSQITFSGEEEYSASYVENSADTYQPEDVYFTEQGGESVPLDTERVSSYLSSLSSLALTDYVTYNASQEELSQYGLDSPELTVAVDYSYEDENGETVSDTFSLSVSRDPEEAEEAAEETEAQTTDSSEEEEEITAYARVGESPIVYQIAGSGYEALMQYSYDDLRHSEVLTADFADITQLDITLEENQYTISSEETEEGRVCSYNGQELDVTELESALTALTADSFADEEPSQKEEISLTVHLDNENFPTVEIVLYRYDGEHCLAQVDGKSFALVSRSLAVDLIEAVNAIVLS